MLDMPAFLDAIDRAEPVDSHVQVPTPADGVDVPPPQPPGPPGDLLRACSGLDQNDTDNGRRLLLHFGDEVVHVREIGWHCWTGTHWDPDGGTEAIERFAQETARRIRLEAAWLRPPPADAALLKAHGALLDDFSEDVDEVTKELRARVRSAAERLAKRKLDRHKFSVSCGNRNRTVSMIAQALPHRSIPPEALDADPLAFNVQNGTLHFSVRTVTEPDLECPDPDIVRLVTTRKASMELRPHARGEMIAKIAGVGYEAGAECPRWTAFLERFQPDPAQRRFLQVAAGRGMLGGAATQTLIYLYGDGANGKSVFMETVARVLGEYAGRMKPESISGALEAAGDKATPDFARLAGKRFVSIAELQRGSPLREGLIKTMTGGEPMPVRHLNKGFFDLTPEFIPFISGNDLPEVGGLDHGIWRRLRFVEWPVKIDKAEQRPLQEVVQGFLDEGAGVLRWLAEGACTFLEEGLVSPPSVDRLTDEAQSDRDPVGNFLKACVRTVPHVLGVEGEVQARLMYRAFVAWCHANAERPWKEAAFGRALKKKGLDRDDERKVRFWTGVELFDVPATPSAPTEDPGWRPDAGA